MRASIVVACGFLAFGPLARVVDVTTCGQVIESGRTAELRRDLACTAQPTWPFSARGVHLEPGATLRLNGFTIAGDGTSKASTSRSRARSWRSAWSRATTWDRASGHRR